MSAETDSFSTFHPLIPLQSLASLNQFNYSIFKLKRKGGGRKQNRFNLPPYKSKAFAASWSNFCVGHDSTIELHYKGKCIIVAKNGNSSREGFGCSPLKHIERVN
jgi:hypothetical protein